MILETTQRGVMNKILATMFTAGIIFSGQAFADDDSRDYRFSGSAGSYSITNGDFAGVFFWSASGQLNGSSFDFSNSDFKPGQSVAAAQSEGSIGYTEYKTVETTAGSNKISLTFRDVCKMSKALISIHPQTDRETWGYKCYSQGWQGIAHVNGTNIPLNLTEY